MKIVMTATLVLAVSLLAGCVADPYYGDRGHYGDRSYGYYGDRAYSNSNGSYANGGYPERRYESRRYEYDPSWR